MPARATSRHPATYDAVGNVTRIVDGINTETVDYTYDDLDRLLTASVPAGESFAYDKIGNLTSKAGTTLGYGTTAPKHAVKSHGVPRTLTMLTGV